MRKLLLFALVGLGAQLVDGSLGMAYGVTSTTLLLAINTSAASASATVHLAEIGTTLASGAAHWRFGNVDWGVVLKVGIPGAVGAFAGATFLSSLSTAAAAPIMALILFALGCYLLIRFTVAGIRTDRAGLPLRKRFLGPLGLVAGFVDATGGGGWGPVGTPAILASGRLEPRRVIGSIDTSEFLVAVAASLGFLVGLGSENIDFGMVGALLLGGLIAAPIAAWLVRKVPPRVLGSAVGGAIILTNGRTLLRSEWIDASDPVRYACYTFVLVAWVAAVAWSVRQHLAARPVPPTDVVDLSNAPVSPVDGGSVLTDGGSGRPDGTVLTDGGSVLTDGTVLTEGAGWAAIPFGTTNPAVPGQQALPVSSANRNHAPAPVDPADHPDRPDTPHSH